MEPFIGKPLPRLEDPEFLTGTARFTDDINLPDQAYAVALRSPHAHARITAIERDDAAAIPGVLGIFVAADLREAGIGPLPSMSAEVPLPEGNGPADPLADASQYPLAEGTVRYVGQPVAFVVAETLPAARDAAESVIVEYDELPAVTTIDAALADEAPPLWEEYPDNRSFAWDSGDADGTAAAFDDAAHAVELTVEYPREIVAFMEPRAALAEYDGETGRFTLTAGCQGGHTIRAVLSRVMGIEEAELRVVVPDVGGGFGARGSVYPEFALVLHAARQLGRPVKWTADRSEAFLTDSQARSQRLQGALALDTDGNFTAIRVAAQWWHGGYLVSRSIFVVVSWMSPMVCGPYRIPTYHFGIEGVFTNTAPIGAYRGVARAELTYLLERLIDKAARTHGFDRIELRRRNLIARADMPYAMPTGFSYQEADFLGSLEQGLKAIDAEGFARRRDASGRRGRKRGLGVTTYIENAGGALADYAELTVGGAGGIEVQVGTQDFGMGHATVFAQVIADVLGVTPEAIRVHDGDTDRTPIGGGAHGSRCMRIGGGAVHEGAVAVIEAGRPLAAELLEAAANDIEYRDGAYVIAGTDRTLGLFDVAREAEARGARLSASETFEVPGYSYPNGAHFCEVEVDPETGDFSIDRYVVVSDPGRVINPLLAAGQLHGGIAQGIGQAVLERAAYDPETGQLLSGSFMDFAMPRADDMPDVEVRFNPVDGDDSPVGAKGIGEGPTTASPPTVVNAVLDALGELGVTHLDMPLTPETVWRAIEKARSRV